MIADIILKLADQQDLTADERLELANWFINAQNVPDVVQGLVAPGSSRVTALSQITPNLGVVVAGKFIAAADAATSATPTDAGFTGSFVSGNGEVFGNDTYNMGGVNAGTLEWGASQTTGKITAGADALTLGWDGISLTDSGDAIVFFDSLLNQWQVMSEIYTDAIGTTSFRNLIFRAATLTNQITNGDFETGDFSSWTVTDPGNHLSVVSGTGFDNSYAVHFNNSVGTDTLVQSLATTCAFGVVVKLNVKTSINLQLQLKTGGSVLTTHVPGTSEWRTLYIPLSGSATSITIDCVTDASGVDAYLDNIIVYKLNGVGVTPYLTSQDVAGNLGMILTSPRFQVQDFSGNIALDVFSIPGTPSIFEVNQSKNDMDARIKGQTDDNNFYSDASTNRIGIGTSAPGYKLDVNGDVNIASGSKFKINGTNLAYSDVTTRPTAETQTNDIFRVDSPGGNSAFVGTINGTPSGTTVNYNVTSGNEGAMVPTSTSQLGKMRLYNTTRSNHALISNCNTTTNAITLTATVPANWANGDTIQIASDTVSGGGVSWVDIEITSGPTGKTYMFMNVAISSATGADAHRLHPYETFATSKIQGATIATANNGFALLKITSNVYSLSWTGTPTAVLQREAGYLE